MDKEHKETIIAQYGAHSSDTGSTEVQVALLTHHIRELTSHQQVHKKDHGSRRGLLLLVGRRRRLLAYLAREDSMRHRQLLDNLGLRG